MITAYRERRFFMKNEHDGLIMCRLDILDKWTFLDNWTHLDNSINSNRLNMNLLHLRCILPCLAI